MESLYLYFLKCFGLIALFFLAYYFLLRKETFFNGNRWFLMAGLFTSVVVPLVFFTKIVWVAPTSNEMVQIPMKTILEKETFEINWILIIGVAYAIGLLVFLLKFGIDFFSLTKVLKGKAIKQQADFKFVDIKQNTAPFSYFNYIVYNSDLYSASELENILEHEKVHSAQNHTIDVLIARLFCIIFWYNPFIWWYKKAILQNLEFIADSEATKNLADKKAYQITLLKITTHENCVAITNHFYQSLIKKRIVMLNKNQSKKWNSWKYALVIPVLVAFVFLFQIEVIAQEKATVNSSEKTTSNQNIILVITKNSTDAALNQNVIDLKNTNGITLNISKVKRNTKGEIIGIKITFKDKEGSSGVNQVNGDKPIQQITFVKNTDDNGKSKIGFFTNKSENSSENINNVLSATETPEPAQSPETPQEPQPVIFVNGVRIDDNINDSDVNTIESMDVLKGDSAKKYDKNGEIGLILIKTKKDIKVPNLPSPPSPPSPPAVPTLMIKSPKNPKEPKAPKGTPAENKIAWTNYEKLMKDYEFQIEKMQPEMETYEANMKVYEERMKVYEEQMKVYEERIKSFEEKNITF